MFQARHYKALAATVRIMLNRDGEQVARVAADRLATMFQRDNARFDESRFYEACGFDPIDSVNVLGPTRGERNIGA